jgi:hypothetical protein
MIRQADIVWLDCSHPQIDVDCLDRRASLAADEIDIPLAVSVLVVSD